MISISWGTPTIIDNNPKKHVCHRQSTYVTKLINGPNLLGERKKDSDMSELDYSNK